MVQGTLKYDGDGNGYDQNDLSPLFLNFDISKGNEISVLMINRSPFYIHLNPDTYSFKTSNFEANNGFEISPAQFEVIINAHNDTITQNFCITPKEPYRQVDITIIPLTPPARPGFDTQYKIIWENKGNLLENGTIYFTYDENIFDYVDANQTPDAINSGKLSWDYKDLRPFEKREDHRDAQSRTVRWKIQCKCR